MDIIFPYYMHDVCPYMSAVGDEPQILDNAGIIAKRDIEIFLASRGFKVSVEIVSVSFIKNEVVGEVRPYESSPVKEVRHRVHLVEYRIKQ
mgnify:CR=1 FL=1